MENNIARTGFEKLIDGNSLTDKELCALIDTSEYDDKLFMQADIVRRKIYGDTVYIRGLIEFTNYCKNNCYYCGIRAKNSHLKRYRLTKEEILSCCKEGYNLGFRTFVLQGGEDEFYTTDKMCDIISVIHHFYPDCIITLSIGEKEKSTYQAFYDAGARRYLLRHETADDWHYQMLHPENMSLDRRKKCLFDLKEIGYQVGTGFMVGSPYQTTEHILCDIRFMQNLSPDMIGIGTYISHFQTPFSKMPNGELNLTLRLLAILRLLFPYALIPATTALGTIAPNGRELGLKAGANVLMPNLSPVSVRKLYMLYDNKICTGEESAKCITCFKKRVESVGYHIVTDTGNVKRSE